MRTRSLPTLASLATDERGAVTVDWVSLTASLVVVGLAIVWYIMDQGVNPLAAGIVESLTSPGLTATPTSSDAGG